MKEWLLGWRIFWHLRMNCFARSIWKEWRTTIVTQFWFKEHGMSKDILHSRIMQSIENPFHRTFIIRQII
jgi:hypothetical protein